MTERDFGALAERWRIDACWPLVDDQGREHCLVHCGDCTRFPILKQPGRASDYGE